MEGQTRVGGGGGNQLEIRIKLTDKPRFFVICISVRNASQSVPLLAAVSDRDEQSTQKPPAINCIPVRPQSQSRRLGLSRRHHELGT